MLYISVAELGPTKPLWPHSHLSDNINCYPASLRVTFFQQEQPSTIIDFMGYTYRYKPIAKWIHDAGIYQ